MEEANEIGAIKVEQLHVGQDEVPALEVAPAHGALALSTG